ncbi:RES family NAD+ phosphorylase [Methylosinus sp. PW1]|uniref:RES family NAD+ phosphorylase n=1 Tax=Methylosinus sp. PW1 TaxID=107636 RepID=UPI00055D71DF|nr:RES family NAD+ phosphorylase [Methylosinus sp. PW1]
MRLWRISNFADLEGGGGLLFPARWHNAGRPILYAAESPAGALLEVLAHLDREDFPDALRLIEIDIADPPSLETLSPEALPPFWREDISVTRSIGDAWLASGRSLALRVPSVLAPRTWNQLLNPRHADSTTMRIVATEHFPLDERLK